VTSLFWLGDRRLPGGTATESAQASANGG